MSGISDIPGRYQQLEKDLLKKAYDAWREEVQEEGGCTIMYAV